MTAEGDRSSLLKKNVGLIKANVEFQTESFKIIE